MGAGEEHLAAARHQFGEQFGAADDRDAVVSGGGEFGVVLRNRGEGGHHDRGRLSGQGEVAGVVADGDVGAGLCEDAHGPGVLGVGAGDDTTPVDEDAGDAGHAGSADADEVDAGQVDSWGGHWKFSLGEAGAAMRSARVAATSPALVES